ncbi:hypothetical protein P7K49_034638 [Saguinus oedipus]|uniref:Uncharacterized protein n=1 Tax=Saguinus oedipus TaxID=9490 RepID=A0ABQ9TVU7_SAGOE|nr:hypothetical protein P7K49_034638 [Saguinus oedipus]
MRPENWVRCVGQDKALGQPLGTRRDGVVTSRVGEGGASKAPLGCVREEGKRNLESRGRLEDK